MNKYRNEKIEWNGERFDSKKELQRYQKLLLIQRAGGIRNLKRQVPFILQPTFKLNGKTFLSIRYIADFVYEAPDKNGNVKKVVEDVKGFKTDVYEIKRKMFARVYGFEITEV